MSVAEKTFGNKGEQNHTGIYSKDSVNQLTNHTTKKYIFFKIVVHTRGTETRKVQPQVEVPSRGRD